MSTVEELVCSLASAHKLRMAFSSRQRLCTHTYMYEITETYMRMRMRMRIRMRIHTYICVWSGFHACMRMSRTPSCATALTIYMIHLAACWAYLADFVEVSQ